jgi:hypothetical protein
MCEHNRKAYPVDAFQPVLDAAPAQPAVNGHDRQSSHPTLSPLGDEVDRLIALALQLLFLRASESMGNHDSRVVDADSVD